MSFTDSKSLGSRAGVTFIAPEPKSISTYSSAKIGNSRPTIGNITVLPITSLYRSSLGLTTIAVSPTLFLVLLLQFQ